MINLIIAYDDNDSELGDYFEESFSSVKSALSDINDIDLKEIRGLECNEINILAACKSENPFIFVGLSHGNESQLITENEAYVKAENVFHFRNSFFYSTACRTASKLGISLIDNGCSCYVGYNKDSWASTEEFYSVFIECENYCLSEFIISDKPIKDVFDEMLDFFDSKIDLLTQQNEIFAAIDLQNNKDNLVLFGNESLRITDFKN